VQLSIHFPRKPHRRARSHRICRWLPSMTAAVVTKGRGRVQLNTHKISRSGQRRIIKTRHHRRRSPAIALHESLEGVRNFSRHRSAKVRCFTGGNSLEARSSITIIVPKCLMSFSCHRAGTPRYRHCWTVRNRAPSERAARSTACRVNRFGSIVSYSDYRARACDKV
jgi:hypothetical protein